MYKAICLAIFLFFLCASSVAEDGVVKGIVENVRIETWGFVDERPDETFITLESGRVFRIPSRDPIGIGQNFEVEVKIPANPKEREDDSITACAVRTIALPILINGKETSFPVDKKEWIVPLQEDGCSFKGQQSNNLPQGDAEKRRAWA